MPSPFQSHMSGVMPGAPKAKTLSAKPVAMRFRRWNVELPIPIDVGWMAGPVITSGL